MDKDKILIVDDEKMLRERLKKLFEMDDFEVLLAEDGPQGLKLLSEEKPDIMILDIKMPGMDGVEVLTKLKEQKSDVEVIMVTGHASIDTLVEILRLGAFDYLQKPVDFDELEIIVKRALEKKSLKDALFTTQQAKDVIEESEKKYRTLFEKFSDGILIKNLNSKKFTWANRAICEMLDYSSEEIYQLDDMALFPAESHDFVRNELAALGSGEKALAEAIPCQTKLGRVKYADINCSLVSMENAENLILVLRDITERKKIEEERASMQKKVLLSSRLASLGEMAAGMAHEINNPLYSIKLNMECMETDLETVEFEEKQSVMESIEQANLSIDRITGIIKNLRSYTHFSEEVDKVEINKTIEDSVTIVKKIYEKEKINFELNLAEKAIEIKGNRGLFQQIVMNFFTNARYAMKDRGGGMISIKSHLSDESVTVAISDNGCGIDQEKIYKIFDAFYTTKPIGEGTGLGLNLVHSIITRMKGHVMADSQVGVGTTFTMTFPTWEKSNQLDSQEKEEKSDVSKLSGKLLVVDDEENIRMALSKIIRNFGLEVETACDGLEGLEKLQKGGFDYLITDVCMPQMSGDQLIKQAILNKFIKKSNVVVVTGGILESYSDEQREAISEFAENIVQKPFSKKGIYKLLTEIEQKNKEKDAA